MTVHPPRAIRTCLSTAALLAGLAGCSPSQLARQTERDLRQSVMIAARQELADAEAHAGSVVTTRRDSVAELGIKPEVMQELEKMSGLASFGKDPVPPGTPLGDDLTHTPPRTATLSLKSAVQSALENNLAVQFARLGPAIGEAQVISAEGAFDWTLFSNSQFNSTDSPRVSSVLGPTGVTSNVQHVVTNSTGLRRTLISGGRVTIQIDHSYTDDHTPNLNNNPNPAQQVSVTLQVDQPLLRNAGSEVTQGDTRLAHNIERNAIQSLRRDLIRVLSDTEKAYWDLVQSRADLLILQRLLERGEKVKSQLEQRARIDANQAQIADARARVERRKADVQRAQTQLRLASDKLKSLVNDPSLPVGSEVIVLPSDETVDQPVKFSLAESLRQAIAYRPEVQLAVLAIDDASIRQIVARNQKLPDLSLRLQAQLSAIDNTMGESYGRAFTGKFVDYIMALVFEMPLGNRKPEAEYRRRRLERMQSVIAYRNTLQQVVGDVKTALDHTQLNYGLIAQTRASRLAAAEVLRVLLVEKEGLQGPTVERLDLELNREESLAQAERDEVGALVEYNKALADLFQSMGTTLERNNIDLDAPSTDDTLERSHALP